MISEKQKELIFTINCFYQVKTQLENESSGKPIESLSEFLLLQLSEKGKIDWSQKQNQLKDKLNVLGLSNRWIEELLIVIKNFQLKHKSIAEFRIAFLTPINLLIKCINQVIPGLADPNQLHKVTLSIIDDTFDKDYWPQEMTELIETIRTLEKTLYFSRSFIHEFGIVLVSQK